ncbi:histone-lysine N-methyltransferase SETMAR [Trichonephila clavipes]|nr:histone-lysine N-methyltransferase SETMAR [Trichonephila clavipes]
MAEKSFCSLEFYESFSYFGAACILKSPKKRTTIQQDHSRMVLNLRSLKRERQCQNWFAKFCSCDFSLKDEKRSGRPVEVDDDLIKAIIDLDRHSTTRGIAEKLHVSHTCIENHLKQLGYVIKLDTLVPHELKETQRINSWDLLKKRNENYLFLKRMITGDEKWVVYNNIKRKISWSRPGEPTQTTHQKLIFIKRRFCYQFGGITKELSTLNSYHPTERSTLMSTLNN